MEISCFLLFIISNSKRGVVVSNTFREIIEDAMDFHAWEDDVSLLAHRRRGGDILLYDPNIKKGDFFLSSYLKFLVLSLTRDTLSLQIKQKEVNSAGVYSQQYIDLQNKVNMIKDLLLNVLEELVDENNLFPEECKGKAYALYFTRAWRLCAEEFLGKTTRDLMLMKARAI